MATRVLIIGEDGMLGSKLNLELQKNSNFDIVTTSRKLKHNVLQFDLTTERTKDLLSYCRPKFVINTIADIPQSINKSRLRFSNMFYVNSFFPRALSYYSKEMNLKLIQPCTNGVYSGRNGPYSENSPKFPTSLYGLTKLIGESTTTYQLNLRCSLIGPEVSNSAKSLLSWFENLPFESKIVGYMNHLWNGISTKIFSQFCEYFMLENNFMVGNLNVIPADYVSKYELLELIKTRVRRHDIEIRPENFSKSLDLRLSTDHTTTLNRIWREIGYVNPPKISEIILRNDSM